MISSGQLKLYLSLELLFCPSSPLSPRRICGHHEGYTPDTSHTFKPEPSFSTQPHIIPQHLPAGFTPPRTLPMSSRHLWHDRYPICQLNSNSFSSNVAKWSHIPLSAFRALLQWLFPRCLSILCQLCGLVCAYQIQGKCLSFRVTCALLQVSLTFCLLTPAFRRISSNQNPCSFFHIFLSPRQFM